MELTCRLGIQEYYFKQILLLQSEIKKLDPEDNGRPEIKDI